MAGAANCAAAGAFAQEEPCAVADRAPYGVPCLLGRACERRPAGGREWAEPSARMAQRDDNVSRLADALTAARERGSIRPPAPDSMLVPELAPTRAHGLIRADGRGLTLNR